MNERDRDTRHATKGGTASGAPAAPQDAGQKDHFLQLMFFQGHQPTAASEPTRSADGAIADYAPLRHSSPNPGERYTLPRPGSPPPIRLDAPARDVMTDLRRVSAVTIAPEASIDEANRAMIAHRVRALFVVDDAHQVSGIVTSTDILGERPIQFAQERGMRHGEVVVRDIMTPAGRLEILDFHDVEQARVGDIVATLKLAGRQHALVVETVVVVPAAQRTVCGIFSLTQIARQLGILPQQVHDIARTVAEIQAVITSEWDRRR